MRELEISTQYITLGQALKLSGEADSGFYAKMFIQEGDVKVNGKVDLHRGRKLYNGDTFTIAKHTYKIHANK